MAAKNQTEVKTKHYHYSGKEKDKCTGLDDYGMRYYAPWLGRWTSTDPAGTVDGLNLYAFVAGNPVTHEDVGGRVSACAQVFLYAAVLSIIFAIVGFGIRELVSLNRPSSPPFPHKVTTNATTNATRNATTTATPGAGGPSAGRGGWAGGGGLIGAVVGLMWGVTRNGGRTKKPG